MNKVKNYFDIAIKQFENSSRKNPVDTYVLMLPEFFWTDLGDGQQYYDPKTNKTEIFGYTAPLYDTVFDMLRGNNVLTDWMRDLKKTSFFSQVQRCTRKSRKTLRMKKYIIP